MVVDFKLCLAVSTGGAAEVGYKFVREQTQCEYERVEHPQVPCPRKEGQPKRHGKNYEETEMAVMEIDPDVAPEKVEFLE
jgi:hypothetical protein